VRCTRINAAWVGARKEDGCTHNSARKPVDSRQACVDWREQVMASTSFALNARKFAQHARRAVGTRIRSLASRLFDLSLTDAKIANRNDEPCVVLESFY
jgi:hypothetical protein